MAASEQPEAGESAAATTAFHLSDDSPASSGNQGTPDLAAQSLPTGASHPTPHGGLVFPPTRSDSGHLNPRSCVTCRRRKVRCDKKQPCSNCVRQHIPCHFPAPGRAPRRPRKPPDGELLDRLRKLEGVVHSLGANPDDDVDPAALVGSITDRGLTADPMELAGPSDERKRMLDYMVDHERKSLNSTSGRLVLDQGKSRYISNSFWANLSSEVEDIKSILHDDADDFEDDHLDPADVTPPLSPEFRDESFIWGHASPGHDLHQSHPPAHIIDRFVEIYTENVEPVMKLFPMDTVRSQIEQIKQRPAGVSRGTEALFFAIYYAAITSISPENCFSSTGESKDTLQPKYRHHVERALARANFLRSEEIVVLQAFVLFITSLRRIEDPRVLWTIVGLLTRISMSMGLHRDPSLFGLSPYDTEIRRRLWWHVCNLDVRLSEDHGSDPTILEHTFDTKLPLNINDDELKPDMPSTVTDRKGITDMTFSLIRFEVAHTFRRLSYQPPLTGKFHDRVLEVTVQDKQRWIEECHQKLEDKYLRYSDKNIPMHWVICTVGRLVLAKMWLSIYQPFQRLDGNACLPQQTRDQLFSTSIESIEYAMQLENEISTMKWNWMFKSYSQWHAMAFLLNEMCHRTKGPLVQRAWNAVDAMLDEWNNRIPYHKRDHIWRPLRKLVAKARAARQRELLAERTQQNKPVLNNGQRFNWDGGNFTLDGAPWSLTNNGSSSSGSGQKPTEASSNDFLPLTPSWGMSGGDIDMQMYAADNSSGDGTNNGSGDLATTPFFANQPPATLPNFASDENSGVFQDWLSGSSQFPPSFPIPRTGSLPNPGQSSNLSTDARHTPQPRGSLPVPPSPSTANNPLPFARTKDFATGVSSTASPFRGPSASTTTLSTNNNSTDRPATSQQPQNQPSSSTLSDPMLTGASEMDIENDVDVDVDVAWADWDSMAREYELEAGQTLGGSGTGMTPGPQHGSAPTPGGYFGAAGNAAAAAAGMGGGAGAGGAGSGFAGGSGPLGGYGGQGGVGVRRPRLGENWF